MNIQERLMADLKDAMRNQDATRRDPIRMVRAAIQNAEIELQRPLTEAEAEQVISREVKRREEAVVLFRQGKRDDLVVQEEAQLKVIRAYLPEQLGEEQIKQVIAQVISDLGATSIKEMGPVTKEAIKRLHGQADGKLVNQWVRDMLNH
jgi:uncharacterized protein